MRPDKLTLSRLGFKSAERNSHLEWKVKFAPGTIEARGTKGNKVVLVAQRETTELAVGIVLRPHHSTILAGGEHISVIEVEIVDARGPVVPDAGNMVQFRVTGSGKLIGVGNGDPSCHEPDQAAQRSSAFNGYCMAIMQAAPQTGVFSVTASSAGLRIASTTISCAAATPRPAAT